MLAGGGSCVVVDGGGDGGSGGVVVVVSKSAAGVAPQVEIDRRIKKTVGVYFRTHSGQEASTRDEASPSLGISRRLEPLFIEKR